MAMDTGVFPALKKLLQPFEKKLSCTMDTANSYCLYGTKPDAKGRPMYFGGVQIKKTYVSFHLMPVYLDPTLLDGLSKELRRQMQGKSCFNFKKVDGPLFKELGALAQTCFKEFQQKGYA